MNNEERVAFTAGVVIGVIFTVIAFVVIVVYPSDQIKKLPDGSLVTDKFTHTYHGIIVRHATTADTPIPQPHQVVCISGNPRTVNILEEAELQLEPENPK